VSAKARTSAFPRSTLPRVRNSDGTSTSGGTPRCLSLRVFGRYTASWIGIAALACLLAGGACSAPAEPRLDGFPHSVEAWDKNRGLPHDTVQAVLQTRDGYLWVGTRGGLARFDGQRWTIFRAENTPAITSDDCRALVEDRLGRLWVGTADGLLQRDNLQFVRFGPEAGLCWPAIRALLCSRATGDLWVGTERGLSRLAQEQSESLGANEERELNRRAGDRAPYPTTVGLAVPASRSDGPTRRAGDRAPYLTRFDNFGAAEGLDGLDIWALAEDTAGTVWVGTGTGLRRFEAVARRFVAEPQPPAAVGQRVTGIHADASGRLWVVSAENPESYYGRVGFFQNGRWTPVPDAGIYGPGFQPVGFAETADGVVWVPDVGGGVLRFRGTAFEFIRVSKTEVRGNSVRAFHADREGNVWAGLNVTGLLRYRPRRVELWTTDDGLPSPQAWAICETRDGALWAGTDQGLCRLGDGTARVWAEREGLSRNMVRALVEDSAGRLWVGTGAGLDCFDHGRLTRYRFPGAWYDSKIRALHLGRGGRLWIAAARNVFGVDLNTLPRPPLESPPLPSDGRPNPKPPTFELADFVCHNLTNGLPTEDVRLVWEDRGGGLWVGTYGGGLARLQHKHWELYNTTQGLPSDRVWACHEDVEGRLWFGTERGLAWFADGRFTACGRGQGFFGDAVHQILEDDFGNLWVSASRGIGRVNKQALLGAATGRSAWPRWVVYDEHDGLLSAETNGQKNHPAACKLRDGRLAFPTTQGVVVFDPARWPDQGIPPLVVIETVRANGRTVFGDGTGDDDNSRRTPRQPTQVQRADVPLPARESRVTDDALWITHPASRVTNRASQRRDLGLRRSNFGLQTSTLRFPPGTAHLIEIHYTAPTFVAADQVEFEHRLKGVDPGWQEAGTRRHATYANLRPRRYRFEVRATNKYGVTSVAPALLTFELEPYSHQTGWFYTLCAGTVLALAAGLYRWRLGYVRRIDQLELENALVSERARIAKDLHDGLGANLTQLTLLADLAEGSATEPRNLAGQLRELTRSTRSTITSLKEFLWATYPADATLEGLVTRVCQHAEEFLRPAGIRCRFDLAPWRSQAPLPPSIRQNIYLIAKEALNNVVRHAHASETVILASSDASAFVLEIADDGGGFVVRQPGVASTATPPSGPDALSPDCHGLTTMRQRAEEIGARLLVSSQPGRGTRVRLEIPLPR